MSEQDSAKTSPEETKPGKTPPGKNTDPSDYNWNNNREPLSMKEQLKRFFLEQNIKALFNHFVHMVFDLYLFLISDLPGKREVKGKSV